MKKHFTHFFLLAVTLLAFSQTGASQTRDPILQPYESTSIWNMPIGSGAVYQDANLTNAQFSGADVIHILRMEESFPARDVFAERGGFNINGGRCSMQDFDLGFDLNVPDDWLVPDSGNSPYGGTPNSSFALITTDGLRCIEGQVLARCEAGGPVYMPDFMQFDGNRFEVNLRGDGLDVGTAAHGASQLSTLGGTIRLGELIGSDPIRHAIKINPFANKSLHYSEAVPGFRWPARTADGYAGDPNSPISYNPNASPEVVMGSLLAIPPSVTAADLGITEPAALKLFNTMQNYGVYFVEDAAFDTWDMVIERDVEIEFEDTYGYSLESDTWRDELNRLMTALHVITNNGPNSIGGGGTPRVPLIEETTPVPLPDNNVFRLRPLSDPTKAVVLTNPDAPASPGRFGLGNSFDLKQIDFDADDRDQLWLINVLGEANGENIYQFQSLSLTDNRVCMDVDNSGFDGATNVHTWACGDPEADNRSYRIVPVPGGGGTQFRILPYHAENRGYTNELRLSIDSGNTGDPDNVASLPADDQSNDQIFTLEAVGAEDILDQITSTRQQLRVASARISVWPQPSNGRIFLKGLFTDGATTVRLMDASGRIISQTILPSSISTESVHNLSFPTLIPGLYFLTGSSAEGNWSKKILVK